MAKMTKNCGPSAFCKFILLSVSVVIISLFVSQTYAQDALSQAECLAPENAALGPATLNKFLVTLLTRTCNLRIGFDHVCESPCQNAIMDIANTAKGCLRYPSFGDYVFDSLRQVATSAGAGGEVPPRSVMNMTELNDWAVNFCESSLFTGLYQPRSCGSYSLFTEKFGVIDSLPQDAVTTDGYKNYLRCYLSITPEGGLNPGERIKIKVNSLDLGGGDSLTIFPGNSTFTLPITSLTGRTPLANAIYSPDGSDSLLLAFESDAFSNEGSGFSLTYEVTNDDLEDLTGCNDPIALNFNPTAVVPKTTVCEYDFNDGTLLFSGSSGHVEVPDILAADHLPTREITMSAWVKLNDRGTSRYQSYVSHLQDDFLVEKGFQIGVLNLPEEDVLSHSCAVYTAANTGYQSGPYSYVYEESTDNVKFGEWQSVVCTYNGATIKLFVDGQLVATSSVQLGDIVYPDADYEPMQSTNLLTMGAYHDSDDYYTMHGEMDEAMIYNCALPDSVVQIMAQGRRGTESVAAQYASCLMHWYRFNENGGEIVYNEIEESLSGIIVDPLGDQVFRAEGSGSLPA